MGGKENPERARERAKLWARNNPDKVRIRNKLAKLRYPGRHLIYQRNSYKKARERVIEGYGSMCSCCGEMEPKFLGVDHVANDGAAQRRSAGSNGIGWGLYRQIIRAKFPDKYQLLCHNCNYAKSRGGCPHQSYGSLVLSEESA